MSRKKLLVIGLDAAAPELVFKKFRNELPNLSYLMSKGVYGRMRSCDPPITIPAWAVMVTGLDPGALGVYGFKSRKRGYYLKISLPSSHSIKAKKVWDILGEAGYKSGVISVPPSYPPQPLEGFMVSCFLTPDDKKEFTYPRELKHEILDVTGGRYIFDVVFRREDRDAVLRELWEMTELHFKAIKYLITHKEWDFFMFVEIGLDRVQHAFWKYFDKEHHLYVPGNKYENVVLEYYKYLDREIGEILKLVDKETRIIVVSDHGAKRMKGAFCVNQWLIEEGYLKLKPGVKIKRGMDLKEEDVDWKNTIAWAWGGYYARIFINVKGREREGVVDPDDYEKVRDELAEKIRNIKGPKGEKWNTKVYKPEELYPVVRGDPADLFVYFDDLYWRAAGTIGYNTLYLPENDKGPDDAVHDYYGIFIFYDPERDLGGRYVDVDILDLAPTMLKLMGVEPPEYMRGRVIEEVVR